MRENRLFNRPIIAILLMVTGLAQLTHNLPLSIISGICLYIPAYFIDQIVKRDK